MFCYLFIRTPYLFHPLEVYYFFEFILYSINQLNVDCKALYYNKAILAFQFVCKTGTLKKILFNIIIIVAYFLSVCMCFQYISLFVNGYIWKHLPFLTLFLDAYILWCFPKEYVNGYNLKNVFCSLPTLLMGVYLFSLYIPKMFKSACVWFIVYLDTVFCLPASLWLVIFLVSFPMLFFCDIFSAELVEIGYSWHLTFYLFCFFLCFVFFLR